MADELSGIEKKLYADLAAAAPVTALVSTRIYALVAPQGSVLPYVVYGFQEGADRNAVGANPRIFVRPVYLIKAVTEGGSYANGGAIYDAVETVLAALSGTVTINGATIRVLGMYREQPVRYVETVEGKRYVHTGGLWRIHAHYEP